MRRAGMESSQFLRSHSSTRTKLLARERTCEKNLFLFQSEEVNIVRSHVANQHRGVCRIKPHPKVERPCETESFRATTRAALPSDTRTRNAPGSSQGSRK